MGLWSPEPLANKQSLTATLAESWANSRPLESPLSRLCALEEVLAPFWAEPPFSAKRYHSFTHSHSFVHLFVLYFHISFFFFFVFLPFPRPLLWHMEVTRLGV